MITINEIEKNLPNCLSKGDVNEEDGVISIDVGTIDGKYVNGELFIEVKDDICKVNASVTIDIVVGQDEDGDEDVDTQVLAFEKAFNSRDTLKIINESCTKFQEIAKMIEKNTNIIINNGEKTAEFKALSNLIDNLM